MGSGYDGIGKGRLKFLIVYRIASLSQKAAHLLISVDPCVCEFPELTDETAVLPVDEQSDDMDVSAPVLC